MGVFSFRDDYQVSPVSNKSYNTQTDVIQGKVKKVFLDFGSTVNGTKILPGAVEVDLYGKNKTTSVIAYPENEKFLDLPLKTEVVDVSFEGSIPVYRRLNLNKTINHGGSEAGAKQPNTPQAGLENFKSLSGALQTLASVGGNFGDYFKKEKIGRLKLFEGDTLIQSRFGQSIRLSGYNNNANKFEPTITIRNKQKESKGLGGLFGGGDDSTLEDLNKDGSTILLSSGKTPIKFIPGTTDKLGGSDFKTRPDKGQKFVYIGKDDDFGFEAYPSSLNGEQIFITSDRLIFSSRKNEMIFWSKGNYGIISDGIFTVDTDRGININSKNHIDIQAFNNQINLHVGDNGEINLGSKNLVPAIAGDELVKILRDLIAEIINLRNGGYLTPSGPVSGMNTENENKLKAIGSRLNNVLSSTVKIQM